MKYAHAEAREAAMREVAISADEVLRIAEEAHAGSGCESSCWWPKDLTRIVRDKLRAALSPDAGRAP